MNDGLRLDPPHAVSAPNLRKPTLDGVASTEINRTDYEEVAGCCEPIIEDTPLAQPTFVRGTNCQAAEEHINDLIVQIQAWAARLDHREAVLNSREALLEHRERAARMSSTNIRRDLEEQLAAVKEERERFRRTIRGEVLASFNS